MHQDYKPLDCSDADAASDDYVRRLEADHARLTALVHEWADATAAARHVYAPAEIPARRLAAEQALLTYRQELGG